MQLVTNLFLTASLALLLSFLLAKLVSFAMAPRHSHTATKNADQPVILQELQFKVHSAQTEVKVEFLTPVQVSTNVEIEHHAGEISVEPDLVELPVTSDIATAEVSDVDVLMEQKVTKTRVLNEGTQEFGPQAVGSGNLDDSAEQRNTECIEEIGIDSSTEVGISAEPVVESGVKERDEEREVALDFEYDDDDDWEGIERSELEMVFKEAVEFVAANGSGDVDDGLASIGSDVQMELYGLHKVATEGPCREPQPMAFKLSARAKWNAWQKLGNMSPEVAMEQYITLLSGRVPGWMKDNSSGKSEQESTGLEVFDSAASDLSTSSLSHHQNVETERELELQSSAQDCSLFILSDSENNVKK